MFGDLAVKTWLRRIPGLADAYHRARIFSSMAYWRWWVDPGRQNDRSILTDEWHFSAPETKARYARILEIVSAMRPAGSWGNALELGCAEGFFTQELAARCSSVMACDISQVARSRTAERCASFPNVRVAACDVEHLDLPDRFDLVFAMGVLEFIRGSARFERTALRLPEILNPEGLLILNACRLPGIVRGRKWTGWMACDADQMVDFLSHQKSWRLLHHEFHTEPRAGSAAAVEQVIAVLGKAE